jgi:hypothetical protein
VCYTPPKSPDMNPIEHLWDEIGRRQKIIELKQKSIDKCNIWNWNSIGSTVTIKLVKSMEERIHEVITAKVGPTDD